MLRNVLIMSASGLVLFSKDFGYGMSQPRLIGSLLTAMMNFSVVTTGMPVCYIELSDGVAVTIVMNDAAKIFCALFHDKDDGRAFGKLISTEILYAFIDEYQADLSTAGLNLKDFHGFHKKVVDVTRNAARPVIAQLQAHRGITKALLVSGDLVTSSAAELDQLGVLANLQALISLATDVMGHVGSACRDINLSASADSHVLLRPLSGPSVLIVAMRKSCAQTNRYKDDIDEASLLLEKVSALASMLQAVSR